MTIQRGKIWLADLNPTRGSEQAGTRPVLVLQNDAVNKFTTTVLAAPFTTNLRRAGLPSCIAVPKGEGGLLSDSVLLGHQLRVLDKARLHRRLGLVTKNILTAAENCLKFTLNLA